MTAIIGILNKTTVALAGDSAATVGNHDTHKVYNHANKIFNLTPANPVGVAIYNASEVMGIPWETIIKMYRKQFSKPFFEQLNEYGEDFMAYLHKTLLVHVTADEQTEQVGLITSKVAEELKKRSKHILMSRFDSTQFEQWPPDEQREATFSALEEAVIALTKQAEGTPKLPEFEDYS
ncbi:MAG: hypothetical protein EOO38_20340 [Cytophagaceae bacterium]|nr:MAG: hypothetical protein EOO38_20340 [Cytophagaceae bacterium]